MSKNFSTVVTENVWIADNYKNSTNEHNLKQI